MAGWTAQDFQWIAEMVGEQYRDICKKLTLAVTTAPGLDSGLYASERKAIFDGLVESAVRHCMSHYHGGYSFKEAKFVNECMKQANYDRRI